jgi:hypothetical protein
LAFSGYKAREDERAHKKKGNHRNERKKREPRIEGTRNKQAEIKKEETLKQAGEIAGPPSELQLRGFQFPLSPEHRLNTPNAQRHSRGNEADSGGRKRTPKEGNRGLNPALV